MSLTPTDGDRTLTDLDRDAPERCMPIARGIEPIISRAISDIPARDGWGRPPRTTPATIVR